MKDLIEVRWHARGGQGAKTASLLFAESMLSLGKQIQAFPEYGPERTGAPTKAYNRICNKPIRNYSAILEPNIVVVLDPTLLKNPEVLLGVNENTIILINSNKDLIDIEKSLNTKAKVMVVKASEIAKEILGKNIPNTVMLGSLYKILGLNFKDIEKGLKERLVMKFSKKPEFIEKNLTAIKESYNAI